VDHAVACLAERRARELEEGQDRPWRTALVAEVQVVHVGLIEVDGLLHQTQTEHARVEVHVARRVRCDGGDVVQSLECHDAGLSSSEVVVCATMYMMIAQTTTCARAA
jgi:hypothetical protein